MKLPVSLSAMLLAYVSMSFAQSPTDNSCTSGIVINSNYSKAKNLQEALDMFAPRDLPGLSLAVFSETEGWWAGASGYSRLESRTPMSICHLQYLQSVSKTYIAVAILQLQEKKKIELDAPLTKYLAKKHTDPIPNADKITVRMLLNQTSGIAEYNSHPGYTGQVILNPTKAVDIEAVLQLLKDDPAQFAPGARHKYTNTNYLLLAMIADAITGNHARYIADNIFKPLGMNQSFYQPDKKKVDYPNITDSYWDILNSGRPANITPMQKANVAPLKGDDGVISTPIDAVKFLKGLMEGKLLSDSSMKEMQEWVKNDKGEPVYGLGLSYFDLGGLVAYGHGGGGLGAGCVMAYIPANKVYLFLATNTGVVIDGRSGIKADEARNAILGILLQ